MSSERQAGGQSWASFAVGAVVGGGVVAGAAYAGYHWYSAWERQASKPSTSGRSPERLDTASTRFEKPPETESLAVLSCIHWHGSVSVAFLQEVRQKEASGRLLHRYSSPTHQRTLKDSRNKSHGNLASRLTPTAPVGIPVQAIHSFKVRASIPCGLMISVCMCSNHGTKMAGRAMRTATDRQVSPQTLSNKLSAQINILNVMESPGVVKSP